MDHNPYDVATKELVWEEPTCWLPRLRIDPTLPVDLVESGITTLTASADKVLRINGPSPFLLNLEFQAGHMTDLVRTLWFRQVALDYQHELPVLTALILLRKEADSPGLTGIYERNAPDGRPTNRYHYEVVRLWKEDPEFYLSGSIGLVPLAPLTAVSEPELPGLVRRMRDRLDREDPLLSARFLVASYLLMGLRFPGELIDKLFEGAQNMKESATYQKILGEGRITEARRFLIVLGAERLGEPDEDCVAALEAIESVDRLEAMGRRMIADPAIGSWEDLLR